MPDPDLAVQSQHMTLQEDVAHQAIAFALRKAFVTPGNDTRSILPAVLHDRQCVIQ
jgi:hypothetical protein